MDQNGGCWDDELHVYQVDHSLVPNLKHSVRFLITS